MVEIEMKAHVRNPEAVAAVLTTEGEFLASVDKRDQYWLLAPVQGSAPAGRFRLRSEGGRSTVTRKVKSLSGGMEVNAETEFQVSDPEAFLDFARCCGCIPLYQKRKTAHQYRVGRILAELVNVEGLGNFLELEILTESAEREEVCNARDEIEALFRRCSIPRSAIEERFYSEMLGIPSD